MKRNGNHNLACCSFCRHLGCTAELHCDASSHVLKEIVKRKKSTWKSWHGCGGEVDVGKARSNENPLHDGHRVVAVLDDDPVEMLHVGQCLRESEIVNFTTFELLELELNCIV